MVPTVSDFKTPPSTLITDRGPGSNDPAKMIPLIQAQIQKLKIPSDRNDPKFNEQQLRYNAYFACLSQKLRENEALMLEMDPIARKRSNEKFLTLTASTPKAKALVEKVGAVSSKKIGSQSSKKTSLERSFMLLKITS